MGRYIVCGFGRMGRLIVALRWCSGPNAEMRIEAGDQLVVMGQSASLQEFERRLGA